MSNSGRSPYSTNPLSKTPPLATVRREQAQLDPLASRAAEPLPQPPASTTGYDAAAASQRSPVYNNVSRPLSASENLEVQVDKFLANCRVTPAKAIDFPSNLDGLLELRKGQAWQDVIKLSQQLMTSTEILQSMTESEKQRVEQIRYDALFRMKMYDELATEVTHSLSQIPTSTSDRAFERLYSQRLLLQEIAMMTGHGQEAQQGLLSLQSELATLSLSTTHHQPSSSVEDSEDIRPQPSQLLAEYLLWQVRMSLINSAIRSRSWRRALRELRSLLPLLSTIPITCEEDRSDQAAAQAAVLLRLTRLSLHLGDVKSAAEQLERAGRYVGAIPALSADSSLQAQLLLARGTLLAAQEQHEQAVEAFAASADAAQLATSNDNSEQFHEKGGETRVPHSRVKAARLALFDQQSTIAAAAASNLAVCLLFIKDNRGAVTRLESLIAINPLAAMTDAVVFNLCTVYDLSFAPDVSLQKKKLLQKVALRFGLVDPILHWRSFRTN